MKDSQDKKTRTATVSGTGRTSFAFDVSTWNAIDSVSARAGLQWSEWAARAIASRPNVGKASAVRAALADDLLAQQMTLLAEDRSEGPQEVADVHPMIGDGYYRLGDEGLAAELEHARIITRDDAFEGFTLIVGYRAESYGGTPFVAIENRLKGGLHLFMTEHDQS